ncbi:MAG: phage adaptor protein [Pseudomonadales bacterium]
MAITTVGTIIDDRVKVILQEITAQGVRWKNEELVGFLNEGYPQIIINRPDASSNNINHPLVAGTFQTLPANALRLLNVIHNTASASNKSSVIRYDAVALDSTRRTWHGEAQSINVELYLFDENDPTHFYVYPPAAAGAELKLLYSSVPTDHSVDLNVSRAEPIKIPDTYAPALVDWILFRAFSKDAEHTANMARSQGHYQAFYQSLGIKAKVDMATSPNNPSNPK